MRPKAGLDSRARTRPTGEGPDTGTWNRAERKRSSGRHQHKQGCHDRQPDRRSRAASAAERHVAVQAADRVQHPPQERKHGRVGGQAQLLQRHGVGAHRARTPPAFCRRGARSRSTGGSSGASGRPRTARNARQPISLPTRCSSWARETTPPAVDRPKVVRPAKGCPRAATSPTTWAISSLHLSPVGPATMTFRSEVPASTARSSCF